MPWVKQANSPGGLKGRGSLGWMESNGEQTSRGLSGRLGLLRLPPKASAFGLSPGLCSPDPLGRFG
jgi:hypothetical protein